MAISHQLRADIASEIAQLRMQDGGEIQVSGSSELIQFHLIVFPAIIGSGKRLSGDGTIPRRFSLRNTETTATGVVIQVYERTDELQTVDFTSEFADIYR